MLKVIAYSIVAVLLFMLAAASLGLMLEIAEAMVQHKAITADCGAEASGFTLSFCFFTMLGALTLFALFAKRALTTTN